MSVGLVYFSFSQLFKHGVHLGLQSTLLHSSMLKYLFPFNYLKFTLFNLNFAYTSLRLISNFIITMSSLRKFSLVVNSVSFLDDFLVDFFGGLNQPVARGLWVAGRLTNFRFVRQSSVRRFYLHKIIIRAFARIEAMGLSNGVIRNIMNRTFNPIRYKQSVFRHVMNLTRMPRFCFINDSVINAVSVNECFILDIPSICSVDSGSSNSYQVTYHIPGNSVSLSSVLLYYSIHKYSVQRGIYKERYLFILNAIQNKFKMVGILKQLPVAHKLHVKSRILSRINVCNLPFIKVKLKLSTLGTSILNTNLLYNLSTAYKFFFTNNLFIFKKLMKKYLLVYKSTAVYNDYLKNTHSKVSLLCLLNHKFYTFLLTTTRGLSEKSFLDSKKYATITDVVISLTFDQMAKKLAMSNVILKCYFIRHFYDFFDNHRVTFLSLIGKVTTGLNFYRLYNTGLFSDLYSNKNAADNLEHLSISIDLFSLNFLNLYKKLFLVQSSLRKFSRSFAFRNNVDYFKANMLRSNRTSSLLLWNVASQELEFLFSSIFDLTPLIPVSNYVGSYKRRVNYYKSDANATYLASVQILNNYSFFYKKYNLEYRALRPFILSFADLKKYFQLQRKRQFSKLTDNWFINKSKSFTGKYKNISMKNNVNSKRFNNRRW